jgi:hypothetical protein
LDSIRKHLSEHKDICSRRFKVALSAVVKHLRRRAVFSSIHKHLLSTDYVPVIVIGVRDTAVRGEVRAAESTRFPPPESRKNEHFPSRRKEREMTWRAGF